MTWSAHLTVATVVERDGRFLLVEEHSRDATFPVFNQPAGHVEMGETLIEAAIRETLEETAWQVEIRDILGLYSYTPPAFPERTYYRVCFIAQALHDTQQALDPDIIATHWLTLDELQQSGQARSPLVIQAIQDYLAGQRFPLALLNEQFLTPKPLLMES
ncbi:MAG: NUDIX hydrolase [Acinetobacter sp.]|nr:NUDIX hydrolase [Acinetobacter sp.]